MWPALAAIFEKSPGDDLQKRGDFFFLLRALFLLLACVHTHTHNLIFCAKIQDMFGAIQIPNGLFCQGK